jgi:hypothetical protein
MDNQTCKGNAGADGMAVKAKETKISLHKWHDEC